MKSTSPEAPETGPHPKITSGDLKVIPISSRAISGDLGITSGHLPATIPRPPEMARDDPRWNRRRPRRPRRVRTPKSPWAKDQIAKIKDMSEGLKGVAKATSRELARLYEGGERIGNKS